MIQIDSKIIKNLFWCSMWHNYKKFTQFQLALKLSCDGEICDICDMKIVLIQTILIS